jgi:hypothetical protein
MGENDDLHTRLELLELSAAYARGVDRRDYGLIESLFTRDGRLVIYHGDPRTSAPVGEMRGREGIARAMRGIERYERTTHFLGQRSVHVEGERASGETYCFAYHLRPREGATWNYVMAIRYQDAFAREDGRWKFRERVLIVDWTDDRRLAPGAPELAPQ